MSGGRADAPPYCFSVRCRASRAGVVGRRRCRAHKDEHANKSAEVVGTTEPPIIGDHMFVPDSITVPANATVEFKNVDTGPPHTWTVIAEGCDPSIDPEGCSFDSGVLEPGEDASVDLKGLPPGVYTFICRVGQGDGSPFSLVFSPHAEKTVDGWTGMVGTLTVGAP